MLLVKLREATIRLGRRWPQTVHINQRRQNEQLILRNFFSPVEPPCRASLCRYMALLTPD